MAKKLKKSIIFDVDSTLVTIEGLDFLAGHNGVRKKVESLTTKAMEGAYPMNQAMKQKLDLIKPSRADLKVQGQAYIDHLTPGTLETISTLQNLNYPIWLLTGNFHPAIDILAKHLSINLNQVLANDIYFDRSGNYAGFNHSHPLANNGGKGQIIAGLKDRLCQPVFIGDGATDLEAQPFVDLFIGFGGVVERPAVRKSAQVYIDSPNLLAILPFILS